MALSKKTKKKLLIAGGVAGGALTIFGAIALLTSSDAAASQAPVASDTDINAVVTKALAVETDPALLRALATAMLVIPYGNPLRNQVGVLQARATALEVKYGAVQSNDNATGHVGQF